MKKVLFIDRDGTLVIKPLKKKGLSSKSKLSIERLLKTTHQQESQILDC